MIDVKDFLKNRCPNIFVNHDTEAYKCVVKYHALTEMYDRTLTDLRSPYDSTEAYIVEPGLITLSRRYAHNLLKQILQENELIQLAIFDELKKCKYPKAQMWIDEYHRIFGEDGE